MAAHNAATRWAGCWLSISQILTVLVGGLAPAIAAAVSVQSNQLGYFPHAQKIVSVASERTREPVRWRLTGRSSELEGVSSEFVLEPRSGEYVAYVDISKQTSVGNYTLFINDTETPVVLANTVYDDLLRKLLRSFYLQRCGVALDDSYTGIKHRICHTEDGTVKHTDLHPAGHKINATGGWHDAGDYGKYASTTAIVTAEIMQLYEQHPAILRPLNTSIPESNNSKPDVLDEMQVGLDWLLKMQRPDGALHRKLSGERWPPLVLPEEDDQTRYLWGIATDDTAKTVAAWANAARVYAKEDKQRAKAYLQAAKLGWRYLADNAKFNINYHEGDNSGSGPYMYGDLDQESSLTHDRDDRAAAAIQMYLTTGSNRYLKAVQDSLENLSINLYEWKDPSAIALIAMLEQDRSKKHKTLRKRIAERLMLRAQEALVRVNTNRYGVANLRFVWGSNKMAAQEGNLLWFAYKMSGNPAFLHAAENQLHYLMGRNPHLQTFVTDVGTRPVANLNHIFGRSSGFTIPGLLVGGPNNHAQAGIAPKNKEFLSYADHQKSYATNEYAIDYNSSLISLLTRLIATRDDFAD